MVEMCTVNGFQVNILLPHLVVITLIAKLILMKNFKKKEGEEEHLFTQQLVIQEWENNNSVRVISLDQSLQISDEH